MSDDDLRPLPDAPNWRTRANCHPTNRPDTTTPAEWTDRWFNTIWLANLPGTRIGVPAWWVEQLISPEPPVVVGQGSGATGSLSVIRRNTGGPTNRSADGSNPSAA